MSVEPFSDFLKVTNRATHRHVFRDIATKFADRPTIGVVSIAGFETSPPICPAHRCEMRRPTGARWTASMRSKRSRSFGTMTTTGVEFRLPTRMGSGVLTARHEHLNTATEIALC